MKVSAHLERIIRASRRRGSTDYSIKSGIIHSTNAALCKLYGTNYSMKCYQASVTIAHLLNNIGINCEVHGGSACLGRALANEPCTLGWAGFWGAEKHAWVITEFKEVIDLTISQLHMHPKSTTIDEPIPIIWYTTVERLPVIINYMPFGLAKADLTEEEEEEVKNLKLLALQSWSSYVDSDHQAIDLPAPILTGPESLQKLHDGGYPWLRKCINLQDQEIPLPDDFKNLSLDSHHQQKHPSA